LSEREAPLKPRTHQASVFPTLKCKIPLIYQGHISRAKANGTDYS